MGFLMGAYGKLMAGKYLRNLQAQLTQVTRQHQRVTRDVAKMEKMFTSMERNLKLNLQGQMYEKLKMHVSPELYAKMIGDGNSSITDKTALNISDVEMNTWSMAQSMVQQEYTKSLGLWESVFEMQRDSMLEPLKDLEESLQIEKDSLESQIQTAQADYDAKKQEEKEGAKNMAPNYTGQ